MSILATLLLLTLAPAAPTAPKTKADPVLEALLEKGLDLRRRGKDAEALAVLQEAHARAPSPRTLAALGLTEEALLAWLEADAHLDEALASDPWIDEHRTALAASKAKVGARLGRIELRASVDGARLFVDGAPHGRLPLDQPIRHLPGTATLRVEAEGFEPFEAAAPTRGLSWWGFGAGIGAAVGFGTGAGALVARARHVGRYNDDAVCLPPNGLTREQNCGAERTAADTAGTVATVALLAGGALGATSLLLFLVDRPASKVAIVPGPGDAGLGLAVALP